MAEFVNLRTEDMIPELEKMEQFRLFEKDEIRAIAKKRKDYEYKIQRRTKCKEDYLRYIQYEMDILKLIKIRREKMGPLDKKNDVEYLVAKRIHKLFKATLQKFKDDARIYISYFKFCKQVRFNALVGPLLLEMLKIHGDKPGLWLYAANWEFLENKSVENARQFLLRGLRLHPTSRELYTEAFKLELEYAAIKWAQSKAKSETEVEKQASVPGNCTSASSGKDKQQNEEMTDKVLDGELAYMIFESAMKKIQDTRLVSDLMATAMQYQFTSKLQHKLMAYMTKNFKLDELTWDTMARCELEGKSFSYLIPGMTVSDANNPSTQSDGDDDASANTNKSTNTMKERIRACKRLYTKLVILLPSIRMWSFYIETMLELNQDQSTLPKFKKNLLRDALQSAHNASLLQEKYYMIWVEILKSEGKEKKLTGILRTATKRYPSSAELWNIRLQLHLSKDEEKMALQVFREATARLGSSNKAALPLWKMMLQYYHTKDMNKVEQIFQEGIIQGPQISVALKPMYIEWVVLVKGIQVARKLYEKLSIQPPLCLELHSKMASLECMQPEMNIKQVRRCFEVACQQNGHNVTDVWMDYIRFERTLGNPEKESQIYIRGTRALDPTLLDSFENEYSLMKTEST